jgi:hypothetical protein
MSVGVWVNRLFGADMTNWNQLSLNGVDLAAFRMERNLGCELCGTAVEDQSAPPPVLPE